MKQELKQYLKIGTLLLGIALFSNSCQKDDDFKATEQNQTINQTDFKISKVGRSNLEENTKLNSKLTKLSKSLKNNKSNTF